MEEGFGCGAVFVDVELEEWWVVGGGGDDVLDGVGGVGGDLVDGWVLLARSVNFIFSSFVQKIRMRTEK